MVTDCYRLKLEAEDGKQRYTDVATPEVPLQLVQSIPSPKAEPIKLWPAKVGFARIQKVADRLDCHQGPMAPASSRGTYSAGNTVYCAAPANYEVAITRRSSSFQGPSGYL